MRKIVLILGFAFLGLSIGANAQTIIDQGYCGAQGNNLTWVLTSDSVLTTSGSGDMDDYISETSNPWDSYRNAFTTVVIGNGVTNIGWSTFFECLNLASITIPNSVINIGGWAFNECCSLSSITIGNGIKYMGDGAFANCVSLTSITIPDSVTYIGYGVFENCIKLGAITIPDGVTIIHGNTFTGCSGLISIIIPNSVTNIGYCAFLNCSGLTSIKIGDSVVSIGSSTFSGCISLTSITILTTIPPALDYDVFNGVPKNIPVYIPCQSYDSYTSAFGWSDFTNFVCKQISGTIFYQDGTPLDSGFVLLYPVKKGIMYPTDTAWVESGGQYTFSDVANGNYWVKAVVNASNIVPTYYGDTAKWEDAKWVHIINNISKDSIDIRLPAPFPSLEKGNSLINGKVTIYVTPPGIRPPKAAGEPIREADVSLNRPSQDGTSWEIVARTFTNDSGHFEFPDLPAGTYKVMVEMPGMEMSDLQRTDSLGKSDTIEVPIEMKEKEVGIILWKKEYGKLKIYPNPTKGQLTIDNGELAIESVIIYDIAGRVIHNYPLSTINCQLIMDVSHLPKGMYFLKVNNKVVKFLKE